MLTPKRVAASFAVSFLIVQPTEAAVDYTREGVHMDSLIPYPSASHAKENYFKDPLIESCARGFSAKDSILKELIRTLKVSTADLKIWEDDAKKIWLENPELSRKYKSTDFVLARQIEIITEKYSYKPSNAVFASTPILKKRNLTMEELQKLAPNAIVSVDKNGLFTMRLETVGERCGGEVTVGPYITRKGWIHDFSFSVLFTKDRMILVNNNFESPSEWSIAGYCGVSCSYWGMNYFRLKGNRVPTSKLGLAKLDASTASLYLSAYKGDKQAQYNIAHKMLNGELQLGNSESADVGINFLYMAAENGHREALFEIGEFIEKSTQKYGLYQDPNFKKKEIQRFYQGACDGGIKAACLKLSPDPYILGNAFLKGQETPKNPELAHRYLQQAANQGNAKAMYNLGLMYAKGDGIPRDFRQANYWLDRAGQHGLPDALAYQGLIALKTNRLQALRYFYSGCLKGSSLACSWQNEF